MQKLLALLLLAFSAVASAQSTDRVSAAEFGRLWGPALDPSGATQVRNFPVGRSYPVTSTPSITAETGGGLAVSKTARFPVDPTRVIDVTAKAPVSKAAMGKAFKLAVAASGGYVGLGLFAAAEIADWMNQSKLRRNDTTGVFEKQDPEVCTVAPCYSFTTRSPTATTPTAPYLSSRRLACLRAADMYSTWAGRTYSVVNDNFNPSYGMGSCYLTWVYLGVSYYAEHQYFYQSASPSDPQWLPATPSEIETAASTPTMKPEWLTRILDTGLAVDAGDSSLTGPTSVSGPSSSTSQAIKDSSGNTTGNKTINSSSVYNITYNGNTYNVNQVTTTTTINPDGTSTVDTTSTQPAKPETPPETCGLPGKPACKIDETGTPTDPKLDPLAKKTEVFKPITDFVANPAAALPSLPSINWTFQLPTGCAAIALPAFSPWLQSIDVCQFQPMFHEVMNIVWVMGAVFGMIGTFWRSVFSQGG